MYTDGCCSQIIPVLQPGNAPCHLHAFSRANASGLDANVARARVEEGLVDEMKVPATSDTAWMIIVITFPVSIPAP